MGATAAVVLLAGSGSRTNHATNKVYRGIGGETMAVRSCRPFYEHRAIDELYVVATSTETALCERLMAASGMALDGMVVGGATRHVSESNALEHLGPRIENGEIEVVLVHDGARPLYDGTGLDELVARARRSGGAMFGLPVGENLLQSNEGTVDGHRSRSGLWRALTPQAFRARPLLEAFRTAARDGFRGTDTASTFERTGGRIEMLEGSVRNLKVTFLEDFALAGSLVEIAHEVH